MLDDVTALAYTDWLQSRESDLRPSLLPRCRRQSLTGWKTALRSPELTPRHEEFKQRAFLPSGSALLPRDEKSLILQNPVVSLMHQDLCDLNEVAQNLGADLQGLSREDFLHQPEAHLKIEEHSENSAEEVLSDFQQI
ncbi:hypothetical protein DNTS_003293 [Danionella cerebrum]|uniref:Uncharacterized protein n=1 Tax=Danionella cerebrum TaxID=2873325 RepID=A0A553MVJ6_9TELE|nr:hypothetical protein DNTS_003293 [Danionella translucida]